MKKQTKNLTVSKPRKKKEEFVFPEIDERSGLYDFKVLLKSRFDYAFDALYSVLKEIPVSPSEIQHMFYQVQMIQGWSNLFIDSLIQKEPVEDTSP